MAEIEYENRKLFRGRMEIKLPADFKDMPDYLAKKKYPSKFRPPIIIMNEDTTVNYLFNLLEVNLSKSEIVEATKGLYNNLKRNHPTGKFGQINITDRENGQVAWFAYETQAVDAELFNIAYVTDIDGTLLNGAFNCLLAHKDIWLDRVVYSIQSIQEVGGKHE